MSNVNWLFESGAFKVAPADKPFLYTSGLIGPYFINAHFLCGGEDVANEILEYIDMTGSRIGFQENLTSLLEEVYQNHDVYRNSIDAAAQLIGKNLDEIDFISGGERRDWFFSPLVARVLDKPLLWIYKNLSITSNDGEDISDLKGARVVNVADLLTVGSSYGRAWVPALEKINSKLAYSLNMVDRKQGGEKALLSLGLERVLSVFQIDLEFFKLALSNKLINDQQHQLLCDYYKDPQKSMREFLINNPGFIEQAKNSSDEKIKTRIKLMLAQNPYGL